MRRLPVGLLTALVCLAPLAAAQAQRPGAAIIPEPVANRYGLHRAWVAHVDLDVATDRVETVLVHGDGVVVQSARGVVQLFDAETGAARWTARPGNRIYPMTGAGASDKHVAVATGVSVHLFDRATGTQIWERKIDRTPSAAPAVSADKVYVPCIDGSMVAIAIEDPQAAPLFQRSNGAIFCPPVARGGAIGWGTSTGRVYGGQVDADSFDILFQVKTGGEVAAVANANENLYVISRDWYLYALREQQGTELWRFSAGDPVHHVPVPIGDVVYLVAEQNGLFCVAAIDGTERWSAPGIRQLLAANDQRLYATDESGNLTILDAKSGARLAAVPAGRLTLLVTNLATDRIYVGTTTGILQCLHEVGRQEPLLHQKVEEKSATTQKPLAEQPAEGEAPAGDAAPPAEEPPAEAPGGDDADPFAPN